MEYVEIIITAIMTALSIWSLIQKKEYKQAAEKLIDAIEGVDDKSTKKAVASLTEDTKAGKIIDKILEEKTY